MDFRDRTAVVTGAASGIGRALARAFAARGSCVALADVDDAGLEKVREELESGGVRVYSQRVDVSSAEQVEDFCDNVFREFGRVDILCNNAGVGLGGAFQDIPLEDWRWIVGVNFWGVIHGCHFFYPRMIRQGGGGHIVNISSAMALTPLPGATPYGTTKSAVLAFSEALRAEAAYFGIGVSAICPGFVLTNIFRSTRQCTPLPDQSFEESVAEAERRLRRRRHTPETVAEAVLKAVELNRGVVLICPETYLGDFFHRLTRRGYQWFARRSASGYLEAAMKSRSLASGV